MPELPEVETVCRGLQPVLVGDLIAGVDIRRPDLRWPLPERLAERLLGARVLRLKRRAKFILGDTDRGETLILHLGMSGRMLVSGTALGTFYHDFALPQKHDHVILDMAAGARITFNDARRFGAIDLCDSAAVADHRWIRSLGPEPLGNSFHSEHFAARLRGRATSVKAVLLDQRAVAGLGNIYVCEALWRARISPLRLARDVTQAEAQDLVTAIRAVLADAIAAGGSSLRDYRQADGELGYFQHTFAVYGRTGLACVRLDCGGLVERTVQAGRSSFHCRVCQG